METMPSKWVLKEVHSASTSQGTRMRPWPNRALRTTVDYLITIWAACSIWVETRRWWNKIYSRLWCTNIQTGWAHSGRKERKATTIKDHIRASCRGIDDQRQKSSRLWSKPQPCRSSAEPATSMLLMTSKRPWRKKALNSNIKRKNTRSRHETYFIYIAIYSQISNSTKNEN